MSRQVLTAGLAAGLAWGAIATALFMAMFRELLPAIPEMPIGLNAIVLVAVVPFQLAAGIATLAFRSTGLFEIVGLTLGCGCALGVFLFAGVGAIRSRLASGG